MAAAKKRPPADAPERVKMSVLARMSGVPAATIKHYMREGLLPSPHHTSKNMAYYDVSLVPRIERIKELQRTRFLPLKVIREILDQADPRSPEETIGAAIARVLAHERTRDRRTRQELLESGLPEAQLRWLESARVVAAVDVEGERYFEGDDLDILRVLGAARRAGIDETMLPLEILGQYAAAIRALVQAELRLFREGVVPRAGPALGDLTEAATVLSERLVVLLRRKMLLPLLAASREDGAVPRAEPARPPEKRRARSPRVRRS